MRSTNASIQQLLDGPLRYGCELLRSFVLYNHRHQHRERSWGAPL